MKATRIEEAAQKATDAENRLTKLHLATKKKLAAAEKKNETLQAKVEQLSSLISALEAEKEQLSKEQSKLKEAVAASTSQKEVVTKDLEHALEEKQAAEYMWKKDIENSKQLLSQARAETESHLATIAQLQDTAKHNVTTSQLPDNEKQQLQSQLDALTNERATLKAENDNLLSTIAAIKATVPYSAECEAMQHELEQSRHSLLNNEQQQREFQALKAERDSLKAQIEELKNETAISTVQEVAVLKEQLLSQQQRIKELEELLGSSLPSSSNTPGLAIEIATLTAKYDAEIKTAQMDRAQAVSELHNAKSELHNLRADLESARSSLMQPGACEPVVTQLTSAVIDSRQLVSKLAAKLQGLSGELAQVTKERDELKITIPNKVQ